LVGGRKTKFGVKWKDLSAEKGMESTIVPENDVQKGLGRR
jgi:hypothetical protein